MKIILIAVMLFVGHVQTHADEAYAVLEVKFNTLMGADKVINDVAYYYWKTANGTDTGELAELGTKLKITNEVKGKFTEFHLVSGILKSGWRLCGVTATPQHKLNVGGNQLSKEGTRVYHFTKSDSEPTPK